MKTTITLNEVLTEEQKEREKHKVLSYAEKTTAIVKYLGLDNLKDSDETVENNYHKISSIDWVADPSFCLSFEQYKQLYVLLAILRQYENDIKWKLSKGDDDTRGLYIHIVVDGDSFFIEKQL
jgi:hypothetical protein